MICPTRRPRCRSLLVPWMLACAALAGGRSAGPAAETVWPLRPYRIQVVLALAPAPELTPQLQTELAADLVTRCDAVVGAAWDMTVVPAPPVLRLALTSAIDAVAAESLPKESLEFDKVMLLAVSRSAGSYQVTARDFDVRTRVWNAPVSLPVRQTAKLRDAALRAMRKAFAPLAVITGVEQQQVKLWLQAAGLPTRDKSTTLTKPGDVFRPVVRSGDRDGSAGGIAPIPWTYLTIEQVAPEETTSRLDTGLRAPLPSQHRGGAQLLAQAVVPPERPTRLVFQSRTDPSRVLPGYDVFALAADSKTWLALGRSDRKGAVTVPAGEHPLRTLLARSGAEAFARLPLVPGVDPEVIVPVSSDEQRLEAEGLLAPLHDALVDLITLREVLLARARSRIKAGELAAAEALIAELQSLRTREQLAQMLAQEHEKIFCGDAAVQQKIDAMFAETEKLARKYLDPEPVDRLLQQLKTARGGRK